MDKTLKWALITFGIVIAAGSIFLSDKSNDSALTPVQESNLKSAPPTESETEETTPDDSWVPTGFIAWYLDSDVAYRYPGTKNCDDYNCVDIEFVSRYGCSDFYAAANYLDGPDGNVIGYDNATLPSLRPLQKAKLRFEDTSNTSYAWQIADISCRQF